MAEVRFFGIRHHGPGCARSLVRAFAAWQPDAVLVEGPPEADGLLPHLNDAALVPPVALLVHAVETPQQAVFYPFARFSPEWQALRWAAGAGVAARFIDLPRAHALALDAGPLPDPPPLGEGERQDGAASDLLPPAGGGREGGLRGRGDPFDDFARADGHPDGESWWNRWIEERGEDADIFAAIAEVMSELRRHADAETPLPAREAQREAHMRQSLRAARKEGFARIAVVCGAWHVPALQDGVSSVKADAALLKGLPKLKVQATWVPWSHRHLTRRGYGAGVVSPGWYDFLWQHDAARHPRAAGWLARVAALLRAHEIDCSSAHVIEAIRLAETLAALRGHGAPGLAELDEAVRSVIGQGDDAVLGLIAPALHVGDALGTVPADVPVVPLQRDVEQQQKRLRLKAEVAERRLELDLREPNDLARSRLLHRLRLLGLDWGVPERGSRGARGSFHEDWRLRWEPECAITLIEASRWGTTVEAAASARVAEQVRDETRLAALAAQVDDVLRADLPGAVAAVTQALDRLAAVSGDVGELLRALPPLAQVFRYGDVRQTDTSQVGLVLDRLIERAAIGLPLGCAALDADAAQALREPLLAAHAAVARRDGEAQTQDWRRALAALAGAQSAAPLLRGVATRLLLDDGVLDAEAAGTALALQLSRATEPGAAAAWLEGFLNRNALVLLHDARLWALVDGWLSGLGDDHFQQVLPLVRRTFADFSRSERRSIAERAARPPEVPAATALADAAPPWQVGRVAQALPLLQRLLGLPPEAVSSMENPHDVR